MKFANYSLLSRSTASAKSIRIRRSEPLLTENQFSALVLMAFITTLLAPLMLRWSVIKTCSGNEKDQFCELWSAKK